MLRKPHKKARSGCTTCKRRRIKCGEERPQCQNCRVHNTFCTYRAVISRGARHEIVFPESTLPVGQGEPSTFTIGHMELLHHYTTSTALTLSSNAQVREVWQDCVPRLAMYTDYILQALLALSSLHLAYLRPSTRHSYEIMGTQLYQTALRKAKVEMELISDKNCTELYLFSALTCFFSLANNRELAARPCSKDNINPKTDLISWIFLFRGTKMLLRPPYTKTLMSGLLAPMFEQGRERTYTLQAYSTTNAMFLNYKLCEIVRSYISDAVEAAVYEDAVQKLQWCFHAVYRRPLNNIATTDVFVWIFHVSDEYLIRLRRHQPLALVVFICFLLLIQQLDAIWWVEGWGNSIATRLRNTLSDQEGSLVDRLMETLLFVE